MLLLKNVKLVEGDDVTRYLTWNFNGQNKAVLQQKLSVNHCGLKLFVRLIQVLSPVLIEQLTIECSNPIGECDVVVWPYLHVLVATVVTMQLSPIEYMNWMLCPMYCVR